MGNPFILAIALAGAAMAADLVKTSRKLFVAIVVSVAAGVAGFLLVPRPLPELSREESIEEVRSRTRP